MKLPISTVLFTEHETIKLHASREQSRTVFGHLAMS